MPTCPQELPLIKTRLILLSLLLCPGWLRGQEPPPPPPAAVVGAVELSPRLVRVGSRTSPLVSIGALVGFSSVWQAGGVAAFLMDDVPLDLPAPLETLELHLAYWGFRLDRHLISGNVDVRANALFGAGTADLRDAATDVRFRSDNFLLLEPTLAITRPVHRYATVGALVGYRATFGVEDLQSLGADDLSGWSLGFSLAFGPF